MSSRFSITLLLASLLYSLTSGLAAQGSLQDTGSQLNEYLTRLERVGFSGTVLVAKDDRILVERGFGLANRFEGTRNDLDTVLSIGSITKQFTAAAILKLEMMGKLKVEDSIALYLKDVPEDKTSITIHHLLTHSGGLRPGYGGRDSDPIGRDELVRLVLETPLEAPPGDRYEYSNEGYSLLGAIIEIVSGQDYETFLREQLFLPAGMHDTGYVLPKWSAARVAHGYSGNDDWGTITEKGWMSNGPGWYLKANGGIHSTLGDMYRWHQALLENSVLSDEAKKKLFTPWVREGEGADSFYGYGWAIFETPRKTRLIAHNGGNGIFAADLLRYVDEGAVIYAASNADMKVFGVTPILEKILFGEPYPMPPLVVDLTKPELEQLAGEYRFPDGDTVTLEVEGGGLKLSSTGSGLTARLAGLTPAGQGDERAKDVEARTKAALEASARGDYQPIFEAFGGRLPIDSIAEQEKEMWDMRRRRFGEFLGVEIIGSSSGPRRAVEAWIRCKEGSPRIRFLWEGNELAGIRMVQAQSSVTLFPTSPSRFVRFELDEPEALVVTVKKSETGEIRTLDLGGVTATWSGQKSK